MCLLQSKLRVNSKQDLELSPQKGCSLCPVRTTPLTLSYTPSRYAKSGTQAALFFLSYWYSEK